jgi:ring-1,2-phenylacetyl-CoA epoxidase subunit PaaC
MSLLNYVLQLADNSLIYGHKLSEWTGHGPALEVDMALSNIALDNIGAARSFYQYAAEIEGNGKTEDSYPYLRDVTAFKNVLLVEQQNGDFAMTIARSFYFDLFQKILYTQLLNSKDERIASIAEKSLKEVTYHVRFSSEWVIRLGDGTDESKVKMQHGINELYTFTGELFTPTALEKEMCALAIGIDVTAIHKQWLQEITTVIDEATLVLPSPETFMQQGGKSGLHTEKFGYLLAELQYLQRAYPNSEW